LPTLGKCEGISSEWERDGPVPKGEQLAGWGPPSSCKKNKKRGFERRALLRIQKKEGPNHHLPSKKESPGGGGRGGESNLP